MIVIDTRELRSKVPNLLRQMQVPLTYATLEVGDYYIGSIPIERKEVGDYINSLASGHLSTQLYELSHNHELSFLIIEGHITEALMSSKFSRSAYLSSVAGAAIKRAPDGKQGLVNLISVDNEWDTALLLKYMHEKVESGEPRLPVMEKFNPTSDEILVYILSAFPKIGETRARNLLNYFDGLDSLLAASESQIAEVPNIGEKTASELYTTLHRKITRPIV